MLIPFGVFSAAGASGGGGGVPAYELISTAYGTGTSGNIAFLAIPQTYKHLQIRGVARGTRAAGYDGINLRLNDDLGSNYRSHRLYGTGGAVYSLANPQTTYLELSDIPANTSTANTTNALIVDILDYTATSKNKTVKTLAGLQDGSNFDIRLESGLWLSTAAVSQIDLNIAISGSFNSISRFSLYGIKG